RRVTTPQATRQGCLKFAWTPADAHQEYFEVNYDSLLETTGVLQPASATTARRAERAQDRPRTLAGSPIGEPVTGRTGARTGETKLRVAGPEATVGGLTDPASMDSGYTVEVRACSTAGCSQPAVLTVEGVEALPPAPPRR